MELLTSRTSRAKPDSIPSASFWFASSLSRLGQSRKDQTCRSCLWRSVPGRISLWKLCENRWLVNYPAFICLSRDALKAIENFYYNYIPIFSSSFVAYTVPPFLYLPGKSRHSRNYSIFHQISTKNAACRRVQANELKSYRLAI